MPSFETQLATLDDRTLVRKMQKAFGLIAPMSVALPESLFTVGGVDLVDFKTLGYMPVGIVTPDGYKFGREVEKSEVDAMGYASSIRTDVDKVTRSVSMTALEHGRRHIQELKYGQDLSGIKQSATGEVVFDEMELPIGEEYRLLIVGLDGPVSKRWILGKGYSAVKLASSGEETWGKSDPLQSELTFDVFTDPEIGTPTRQYMGGTGALAAKESLGYAQLP